MWTWVNAGNIFSAHLVLESCWFPNLFQKDDFGQSIKNKQTSKNEIKYIRFSSDLFSLILWKRSRTLFVLQRRPLCSVDLLLCFKILPEAVCLKTHAHNTNICLQQTNTPAVHMFYFCRRRTIIRWNLAARLQVVPPTVWTCASRSEVVCRGLDEDRWGRGEVGGTGRAGGSVSGRTRPRWYRAAAGGGGRGGRCLGGVGGKEGGNDGERVGGHNGSYETFCKAEERKTRQNTIWSSYSVDNTINN